VLCTLVLLYFSENCIGRIQTSTVLTAATEVAEQRSGQIAFVLRTVMSEDRTYWRSKWMCTSLLVL